MKVLRSTLVAAVAIFAAACGDKVTVAGPTAVTLTSTTTTTTVPAVAGKVNSVSIAPATATLTIGQTITMIAAVNADAGIATTVTWTSSDATKASVSTAGLVTALVATPGVAICATSTANTGVKGCGSVVVAAATATTPASASIAGVFSGNLTTPITPTNVTGTIFAQVNLAPGTETISKVYLLIGTTVADSQVFTAAQSAALRYAADNVGPANDVAQPTIILTANTAKFDNATGAAAFTNASGLALKVQVIVGAAVRATATYSSSLTLNNADDLIASVTTASTAMNTANSVLGFQWKRIIDSLDVKFTYVSFSGRTVSKMSVRPVCGDSVWTNVTTPFSVRYRVATAGYQTTNSAGGCTSTAVTDGESPVFSSMQMTDGSAATVTALNTTNATAIRARYDNVGPAAPTVSLARNDRSSSWINAAFKPTTVYSATTNKDGAITTGTYTDGGVSAGTATTDAASPTFQAFYISGGAPFSTAGTLTALTTITALGESTVNNAFCLVVRSYDALGNVSALPAINTTCGSATEGAIQFGVDLTAPTANWVGSNAAGTDSVGATWTAVRDGGTYTAPVTTYLRSLVIYAVDAGSGLGVSKLLVSRITASGTAYAVDSSSNVPGLAKNISGSFTSGYYKIATETDGYYAASSGSVKDKAGNSVTLASRTVNYDATVPATPTVTVTGSFSTTVASTVNIVATDAAMGLQTASAVWGLNDVLFRCAAATALNAGKTSSVAVYATNTNINCTPLYAQMGTTTAIGNAATYTLNAGGGAAGATFNSYVGGFKAVTNDPAGNQSAASAYAGGASAIPTTWLDGSTQLIHNRGDLSTRFTVAALASGDSTGAPCSYNVTNGDTATIAYAVSVKSSSTGLNLCQKQDYRWVTLDSIKPSASAATVYTGLSGSTPVVDTLTAWVYTTNSYGRAARTAGAGAGVLTVDSTVTGTADSAVAVAKTRPMTTTVRFFAVDARGHYVSIGSGTLSDSTIGVGTVPSSSVSTAARALKYTLVWTPGAALNRSYWTGTATYDDFAPGTATSVFAVTGSTVNYRVGQTAGVCLTTNIQVTEALRVGCGSSAAVGIRSRAVAVTLSK